MQDECLVMLRLLFLKLHGLQEEEEMDTVIKLSVENEWAKALLEECLLSIHV